MPTLWQVLNAAGREVVSLNLPMTYPPPRVRGLIVAGSDSPGLEWAFAQCPDFGAEIFGDVPDYTHKIVWKARPRSLDELRSKAARNRAIFRAQAEAAERADARCDWSALMVHFHNLDSLQHRLWPYLDVDETGVRQPGWNEEVESCLRALDESVGRLLELASKRDAAVIAVSDHGFGPCRALVNVNGLLRAAGLQRGLMYGTRFRYRAQRLGDRFHRWLTRRAPGGSGRRLPRSIEGQVGCDWKRTVAFAPFGQLSGCIFLNRAAIGNGTAGHAAAAGRVIEDVIEACRDARDPGPRRAAVPRRLLRRRPVRHRPRRPRACPRSSPSRPTATRRRPSGASACGTSCSAPTRTCPGRTGARASSPSTAPTSGPAAASGPTCTTSPRPPWRCSACASPTSWKAACSTKRSRTRSRSVTAPGPSSRPTPSSRPCSPPGSATDR